MVEQELSCNVSPMANADTAARIYRFADKMSPQSAHGQAAIIAEYCSRADLDALQLLRSLSSNHETLQGLLQKVEVFPGGHGTPEPEADVRMGGMVISKIFETAADLKRRGIPRRDLVKLRIGVGKFESNPLLYNMLVSAIYSRSEGASQDSGGPQQPLQG